MADIQEALAINTLYLVTRLLETLSISKFNKLTEIEVYMKFVFDFHLKCSFSLRERRRSKWRRGDTNPPVGQVCLLQSFAGRQLRKFQD